MFAEAIDLPLPLSSLSPTASGIEGIDVIVADISEDASLESMCSKTSVIINCVGPVSGPLKPVRTHPLIVYPPHHNSTHSMGNQ